MPSGKHHRIPSTKHPLRHRQHRHGAVLSKKLDQSNDYWFQNIPELCGHNNPGQNWRSQSESKRGRLAAHAALGDHFMQICNSCNKFRAGTCLYIELKCRHGLSQGKECWLKGAGSLLHLEQEFLLGLSSWRRGAQFWCSSLGIGCELGYFLTSSEVENEVVCELVVLLPVRELSWG